MGVKSAATGGLVAGIGVVGLLLALLYLLFYLAMVVIVFGGAYYVLDHFNVLMTGVPL